MIDINTAWQNYCNGDLKSISNTNNTTQRKNIAKCTDLYISTKTKISYLSHEIDLNKIFWKIPVISYCEPREGIIKKQMKINSHNEKEYDTLVDNINNQRNKKYNIDQHTILRIVNDNGRIKYKDVRKITIGLSNKDIISYKCKKKGAFYNCFVVIIRIKDNNIYREIHVKVFNTGKLEIPGIKNDYLLIRALDVLIENLKPYTNNDLKYHKNKTETVLINSNFTCGYYINREKLFNILKSKYNINSSYDPCSYPGIQSQFYYDNDMKIHTGIKNKGSNNKVSFMIFRTGSVLIVGKCSEKILYSIYTFVKNLLENEYNNIYICNNMEPIKKTTNEKKRRKKIIYVTN